MAQQRLTQDELFKFDGFGNITLLHFADLHAQLMPVIISRAVAESSAPAIARGRPPHVTGAVFLEEIRHFSPNPPRPMHSPPKISRARQNLWPHWRARPHGDGVKAVRASRGEDRVILLDGGDTWQGSLDANRTKGQDDRRLRKLLGPTP